MGCDPELAGLLGGDREGLLFLQSHRQIDVDVLLHPDQGKECGRADLGVLRGEHLTGLRVPERGERDAEVLLTSHVVEAEGEGFILPAHRGDLEALFPLPGPAVGEDQVGDRARVGDEAALEVRTVGRHGEFLLILRRQDLDVPVVPAGVVLETDFLHFADLDDAVQLLPDEGIKKRSLEAEGIGIVRPQGGSVGGFLLTGRGGRGGGVECDEGGQEGQER